MSKQQFHLKTHYLPYPICSNSAVENDNVSKSDFYVFVV
jgi:hypothetical protein